MNWPLLQNSLLLAGTTTVLAVAFGLVAALWLATLEARWRNVFLAAAIVALALPPFLVTNCWISLLGDNGALRTWLPFRIYSLGGTVWILALMLWPITLFTVLSAWRRLEAAQFECEPAMTGFALLRWLLLPVARGELALAALLTSVLALNSFSVPAILQTRVLPDELWIQFSTTFFQKPDGGFDLASLTRLSLPLVIAPLLLIAMFARRLAAWPRVQGTVPARVFRQQLGSRWRFGSAVFSVALCLLSVGLPLAQITTANRTWTELPGAVEAGTGAIWNSFWFATLSATMVVGGALFTTHRLGAAECPTRRPYLRLLMWLPFFVPGILIGIALIKIFNRPPMTMFYQSAGIVLLAFVVRYLAIGLTTVRHGAASVDPDLKDAARLEGASRWQMFRFVVWPQTSPQIFAAWYIVYLFCLWDVESMVLVVPPGGETLALRVFNLLHYGHNAQVNALCLSLLGLAVAPLLLIAALVRTRQTLELLSRTQFSRALTSVAAAMITLVPGCTPPSATNEAGIQSSIFSRVEIIGSRGVGIGEFNKPRSVAVDLQDNLYVVDMTGRVQKFSPEGTFLLSWQMPETALGKPKGMGRDLEGNILVIEPHYQRVNHFSPEGKLVAQWGCKGTNDGCFLLPRAITQNAHGEFLVSEYQGAERVQRFATTRRGVGLDASSHSGERGNSSTSPVDLSTLPVAGIIGKAGTETGEFNRPEGLCVDALDRLYVADSCNHRIQVFSRDGKFIRQYGHAGSGRGELSYPYDIAVDAEGNQFVCEFGNSRIQVFDANCKPIETIGGAGAVPGRFANPWGVALDSRGNLYVADSQNHRVQKLIRPTGTMSLTSRSDARTTHHAPQ